MAECRGFFECLLRLVNFFLTIVGLAMVGYEIYLLIEWMKIYFLRYFGGRRGGTPPSIARQVAAWNRHEPVYGDTITYNEHYMGQITELLTRYGDVEEGWLMVQRARTRRWITCLMPGLHIYISYSKGLLYSQMLDRTLDESVFLCHQLEGSYAPHRVFWIPRRNRKLEEGSSWPIKYAILVIFLSLQCNIYY